MKKMGSISKADKVSIRMYCIGTGDCFVLKVHTRDSSKYTIMIDCGSCQGTPEDFRPYLDDLAEYVEHHIDLLIITHEHNDHVNGFAKCPDIFSDPEFIISNAWFAWTENEDDPDGLAKKLLEEREKTKKALKNVVDKLTDVSGLRKNIYADSAFETELIENDIAFLDGINTLAAINLTEDSAIEKKSLPGMIKIKQILKDKGTKISYLNPGETISIKEIPEFKFHILGPPYDADSIYYSKEKQGTDVYQKNPKISAMSLAANSFLDINKKNISEKDLPFDQEYVVISNPDPLLISIKSLQQQESLTNPKYDLKRLYDEPTNAWRTINYDWLNAAGALALRLNSHINNTSLVIALEAVESNKVILLPGDAEYGSWASWHEIPKWKTTVKNGKPFVEDLLNRTVFYKVGHHLSYNGTALEKGIAMMNSQEFAAMATLDRQRISSKWKSTMPNHLLMKELIKRCKGKLFIMDEFEITGAPSEVLIPSSLGEEVYDEKLLKGKTIYKQYTVQLVSS